MSTFLIGADVALSGDSTALTVLQPFDMPVDTTDETGSPQKGLDLKQLELGALIEDDRGILVDKSNRDRIALPTELGLEVASFLHQVKAHPGVICLSELLNRKFLLNKLRTKNMSRKYLSETLCMSDTADFKLLV